MVDDADTTVTWTREKADELKVAWTSANEAEKESFMFDGNEYLVTYARYLLEYLEHIFGEEKTA
jgi:hypothetical protein